MEKVAASEPNPQETSTLFETICPRCKKQTVIEVHKEHGAWLKSPAYWCTNCGDYLPGLEPKYMKVLATTPDWSMIPPCPHCGKDALGWRDDLSPHLYPDGAWNCYNCFNVIPAGELAPDTPEDPDAPGGLTFPEHWGAADAPEGETLSLLGKVCPHCGNPQVGTLKSNMNPDWEWYDCQQCHSQWPELRAGKDEQAIWEEWREEQGIEPEIPWESVRDAELNREPNRPWEEARDPGRRGAIKQGSAMCPSCLSYQGVEMLSPRRPKEPPIGHCTACDEYWYPSALKRSPEIMRSPGYVPPKTPRVPFQAPLRASVRIQHTAQSLLQVFTALKGSGDPVGYCQVKLSGEEAYVYYIWTDPAYRGLGIGSKLVDAVKDTFPGHSLVSSSDTDGGKALMASWLEIQDGEAWVDERGETHFSTTCR